jgi:hypothetical protein
MEKNIFKVFIFGRLCVSNNQKPLFKQIDNEEQEEVIHSE